MTAEEEELLDESGMKFPGGSRDLESHRRGVVSTLYDSLLVITNKIQLQELQTLQRRKEAKNFFVDDLSGLGPVKVKMVHIAHSR